MGRALLPVERVLKDAGNLSLEDVDVVEIIGGGLRVPKMQALLRSRFNPDGAPESGAEIGVHLNGDEAVALGAVFVAANRSRSFRVRQIDMTDILPFEIQVELRDIISTVGADDDTADDADDDTNGEEVIASDHDGKNADVVSWSKKTTLAH